MHSRRWSDIEFARGRPGHLCPSMALDGPPSMVRLRCRALSSWRSRESSLHARPDSRDRGTRKYRRYRIEHVSSWPAFCFRRWTVDDGVFVAEVAEAPRESRRRGGASPVGIPNSPKQVRDFASVKWPILLRSVANAGPGGAATCFGRAYLASLSLGVIAVDRPLALQV